MAKTVRIKGSITNPVKPLTKEQLKKLQQKNTKKSK